jgi:hypothetical protein
MVTFQWNATHKVWTHGSKVMRFLRFQPKLGHAVNHYQCSIICPKFAKIYPKTISLRNFEMPPKIEILVFFQKQLFLCIEEALEYMFTVWIFNTIIFYMSFLLSKNGLCM